MRTHSASSLLRAIAFVLALLLSTSIRAQTTKEDERPVVDGATLKDAKANAGLPSLFIAGDSTARSNAPMRGWADEFAPFFDGSKINVLNRAIGGRSSRTYIAEGRWDKVLAEMKSGDYLIVQFGHNDVGPIDDKGKFRGSLKGLGDETQEVKKPDGTTETVHTFGYYMTKYVVDAKGKGVHVIIAASVPHKNWHNDFASYREWEKAIAKEQDVPFVDVTAVVGEAYDKLGAAKVETLFADKGTHTNVEGARINAESVVAGIKGIGDSPLMQYLSSKGKAVTPAAAAKSP